MTKNETILDSGISNLIYYDEIPRTSDLRKSAEVLINASTNLLISKFYISPATIKFDNMVEEAIFEINLAVTKQMDLPSVDDILNLSIEENAIKYFSNEADNEFQDHLQRQGYSGELIKVASNLNTSTIDPLTRAILSEEGLFFYLAYTTIKGHGIKDEEGIASNMLESLGMVKSYINVKLVDKVISKENLNVTAQELVKLKNAIRNKPISYFQGKPEKTITDYIDNLKSGGSLYTLVMTFLNSGKVTLKRHTNKEALAQQMVDYLLRLGYNEDFETSPSPTETPKPSNGEQKMADDFEVIEGVGKVTKGKLYEARIFSFSHLAKFNEEGLKKSIKNPQIHIRYGDIITQAKLISEGKFADLVKLQEQLNKRQ